MIALGPARTALVLAAHGSSVDDRCAAPVRRHAAAIAARGIYDEVHCVFHRQAPFFKDLRAMTSASSITVVPVMTSEGMYASTVLPEQMGPSHSRRATIGQAPPDVRLTRSLGASPALARLVLAEARDAAARNALDLNECRLMIIGHGTWRDPARSGASTWNAARAAARETAARGVHVAFLEQLPPIAGVLAGIPGAEPLIVVPNLVANGGHAVDDIPKALAGARRPVFVADAVGERAEIVELILEAAR